MAPMSEALDRLVDSNRELIRRVKALDEHVTLTEDTNRRTRRFTKVSIIFSALAVIAGMLAVWSIHINCENANNSRAAALSIWGVVLSASDSAKSTPEQRAQAKAFRGYVTAVYAPHSCNNPFKTYDLPEPPDLSGQSSD